MINNINRVSNIGDLKMVRFGLDSNISCEKCGDSAILNCENLFDVLYGELGIYPITIYRISLVFTCSDNSFKCIKGCSDNSFKCIKEYIEFNSAYLFSKEFDNFFDELYSFVKEHKEKTEYETDLDSSVVDIIIYEDVNECD